MGSGGATSRGPIQLLCTVAIAALAHAASAPAQPLTDFQLAERFQPYLLFDHSERFRPIDVDAMLLEGDTLVCSSAHSCDLADSAALASPEYDRSSFVRVGGLRSLDGRRYRRPDLECNARLIARLRRRLQDCEGEARLYFHVLRVAGLVYVQYWIFYRFDDADFPSLLAHQADWERVVVAVPESDPRTFAWVGYSAHKGPVWRYPRSSMYCDGGGRGSCGTESGVRFGFHAHVYVADGSHAVYPVRCSRAWIGSCGQNAKVGPLPIPERGFDGAYGWSGNGDPSILRPMETSIWRLWPGAWNAPFSHNDSRVGSPALSGAYRLPEAPRNARCRSHRCEPIL